MTTWTDDDRRIISWLESDGPSDVRAEVVDLALSEARQLDQRQGRRSPRDAVAGWPPGRLERALGSPALRLGLVAALVLALLGVSLAVGTRLLLDRPAPLPVGFSLVGGMSTPRVDAVAATLADGRVLVAGGWNEALTGLRDGESDNGANALATAEVFDPATGRFTQVGPMTTPRQAATATLLRDGRVLVTGGYRTAATADGNGDIDETLTSAEVFDPGTGVFSPVGAMADSRAHHAAVRLDDGSVLVVGGIGWEGGRRPAASGGTAPLATAEIFDPETDQFRPAGGGLSAGNWDARAIALDDGRVLVAAGLDGMPPQVEIFDPASGTFTGIGADEALSTVGAAAVARLPDGRILIAGEAVDRQGLRDLKPAWRLFEPATDSLGPIVGGLAWTDQAISLDDGRVLLVGSAPSGDGLPVDPRVTLFDPVTGTMSDAGPAAVTRERGQVIARTGTGQVLVAGGLLGDAFDVGSESMAGFAFEAYDSAELYTP